MGTCMAHTLNMVRLAHPACQGCPLELVTHARSPLPCTTCTAALWPHCWPLHRLSMTPSPGPAPPTLLVPSSGTSVNGTLLRHTVPIAAGSQNAFHSALPSVCGAYTLPRTRSAPPIHHTRSILSATSGYLSRAYAMLDRAPARAQMRCWISTHWQQRACLLCGAVHPRGCCGVRTMQR